MKVTSFFFPVVFVAALLVGCDGGETTTNTNSTDSAPSSSPAPTPTPGSVNYALSVSVAASGSVTSSPGGISCGADCSESYADGTAVTLTATPASGYMFSGWGGACSGTGSCALTMSTTRAVTATFVTISPSNTTGGPVLFFSDLTSGQRGGNSDTTHGSGNGAIVTVWGKNLGSSQGTSTLSIGGVTVASSAIYSWGNAVSASGHNVAADLYSRMGMQMIEFAIPGGAPAGSVSIVANVGGQASNGLVFTTRDQGRILFVSTGGNDSTGTGNWSAPWLTIQHAIDQATTNDVIYVRDGISVTDELTIRTDGPIGLVAYPGATVSLGGPTGSGNGIGAKQVDSAHRARYWTIAKFRFPGAPTGYSNAGIGDGFRFVGNYVTNPIGEGLTGAVAMGGDAYQYDGNVAVIGNEMTGVSNGAGFPDFVPEKMYHVIYLSGKRVSGSTHAPSMENIEVAWNYLHDNSSNRAIDIYSEQSGCSLLEAVTVHDNVIVNQRGDGILLGKAVTGTTNAIYNNVIVNAGLGPHFRNGEGTSYAAISVRAGWPGLAPGSSVVRVYNNTVYGGGFSGDSETAAISWEPNEVGASWLMTLEFANNIVYMTDTTIPYWKGTSWGGGTGCASGTASCQLSSNAPNLWYNGAGTPRPGGSGPTSNPLFDANARLQAGSPAIDAGSSAATVSARDIDGVPRPQGASSLYDLGAFEHQ